MTAIAKLSYDKEEFSNNFEKTGFLLTHNLVDHPLLQLDELVRLANELPENNIEFNSGDVSPSQTDPHKPKHKFSAEETIAQIKRCKTWLGLKRIESIPRYKTIMDQLLDSVAHDVEDLIGALYKRECFIFISSPNSTVPYHMDPEHNFLLQIQGEKQLNIFDKSNELILTERDFERYYSDGRPENRKLYYDDKLEHYADAVTLRPGDAFHLPITSPHYVTNGAEVSISMSITYSTQWAENREDLYHLNHELRRKRLGPIAYGKYPLVDRCKLAAISLARKLRS